MPYGPAMENERKEILRYGRGFQQELAAAATRRLILHKIRQFEFRTLHDEETLVLKWGGSEIELFIYPDGANLLGSHIDERFETPDFSDAPSMIEEILARFSAILASATRQPSPR